MNLNAYELGVQGCWPFVRWFPQDNEIPEMPSWHKMIRAEHSGQSGTSYTRKLEKGLNRQWTEKCTTKIPPNRNIPIYFLKLSQLHILQMTSYHSRSAKLIFPFNTAHITRGWVLAYQGIYNQSPTLPGHFFWGCSGCRMSPCSSADKTYILMFVAWHMVCLAHCPKLDILAPRKFRWNKLPNPMSGSAQLSCDQVLQNPPSCCEWPILCCSVTLAKYDIKRYK